jgi:hypothetical protein
VKVSLGFGSIHRGHWCDKSVAAPRQGFNESRCVGGVAQHLPKPGDRVVQSVVEIDKCVSRPNLGVKVFARYQIARAPQQNHKHL